MGRAARILACAALAVATGLTAGGPETRREAIDWNAKEPAAIATPAGGSVTFGLTAADDGDVPNSGRGQYDWLQIPSQVPWLDSTDVYWRDQLQWGGQIEKSKGVYDFSVFDRGLEQAGARHARFMFRVMAYCPGCGENLAPSYVPRQPSGAPDWNSPEFLDAWERLMAELGKRYGDDPRLGPIDVGGYGTWGEWLFPATAGTPITSENARRMIQAVLTAFPRKYVLLNFINPYPAMAVPMSPRIGYRLDCIGGLPLTLEFLPKELEQVWRRSPVVGEWCPTAQTTASLGLRNVHDLHLAMLSSGNFPRPFASLARGEQEAYVKAYLDSGFRYRLDSLSLSNLRAGQHVAIRSVWSNDGAAPTYDPRHVTLQLRGPDGTVAWETALDVELLPITSDRGPVSATTSAALPDQLFGIYAVTVTVEDPLGHLPPMRLANHQRQHDGSYGVGYVAVR